MVRLKDKLQWRVTRLVKDNVPTSIDTEIERKVMKDDALATPLAQPPRPGALSTPS